MKFVTIVEPICSIGLWIGSLADAANAFVLPLKSSDGWPMDLKEVIRDFDEYRQRLEILVERHLSDHTSAIKATQCVVDAPIRGSEKLICIGQNYAAHAREMGGDIPEIPVVFSKFGSAIAAPETNVVLPTISEKVDYEAELVVVIGSEGRNIAREDAMNHVFGYCCGNDVSARDWQKGRPGGQWLLGKTFDTFAPLGPMVVTRDEVPDPHQLSIQMRLNGETMQSSNTSDLIFRIDVLIEHLSKFVTLRSGDLIFTGTPSGVGAGREPQVFLKAGDQMEVEIEGLGVLVNGVEFSAS